MLTWFDTIFAPPDIICWSLGTSKFVTPRFLTRPLATSSMRYCDVATYFGTCRHGIVVKAEFDDSMAAARQRRSPRLPVLPHAHDSGKVFTAFRHHLDALASAAWSTVHAASSVHRIASPEIICMGTTHACLLTNQRAPVAMVPAMVPAGSYSVGILTIF